MDEKFNPQIIEKYQMILEKDPSSKVFAPVAEYYRQAGWLEDATQLCRDGVKLHPNFASGYLALARCYFDNSEFEKAALHLQKTISLSPENILAQFLLGQSWLHLHKPKSALKHFKMVLFFNPEHKKASKVVQKLESLTADEFSNACFEGVFTTTSPQTIVKQDETPKETSHKPQQEKILAALERQLSLADAFISRNNFQKAKTSLEKAQQEFGDQESITRRLNLMNKEQAEEQVEYTSPIASEQIFLPEKKIAVLKKLLNKLDKKT